MNTSKLFKLIFALVLFIIFFSIIDANIFAQSAWVWKNPLPQGNNLNRVKMANLNTGYAVGNRGTLLVTTNGTNTWTVINLPTKQTMRDVAAPTPTTAYVVGDSGIIFKTTNAGSNWILKNGNPLQYFSSVDFSDSLNGIVGGSPYPIFTQNGGTNWVSGTFINGNPVEDVQFINPSLIYAYGGNIFAKSSNGGASFYGSITLPHNPTCLFFTSTTVGFLGYLNTSNYSYIAYTGNSGANWSDVSGGYGGTHYKISFSNGTYGQLAHGYDGKYGMIYATSNGGYIWDQRYQGLYGELTGISMTDPITGTAVGSFGHIVRTIDGINWTEKRTGIIHFSDGDVLKDISFVNNNLGFVVGDSTLAKTTDGGNTWLNMPGPNNNYDFWGVDCADENNIIACGTSGSLWKTYNGGNNWYTLNSNNPGMTFTSISYYNSNLAISVGSQGTIIRTTNGGGTWTNSNSGSATNAFMRVQMIDANTGIAVGVNGQIRKTTDGGVNWFVQNCGYFGLLYSVYFTDVNNGWIAADGGKILHSTDGGANWNQQNSGITNSIYAVAFFDANNGYALSDGIILRTTNAGTNWNIQDQPCEWKLNAIYAFDNNEAVVAGQHNSILKTSTGGIIPPAAPVLISPINNSTNQPLNTFLDWSDVAGTTYRVQISSDINFNSIIKDTAGLTTSQYTIQPGLFLNNTQYFWRIRAVLAGISSDWSTIWNFTTIISAPPVPILNLPASNSTCLPLTLDLRWNTATGASSYNLQLSADSLFATSIIDTTGLTNIQLTVPAGRLQNFTKYYWRVTAVNIGGSSAWCQPWNFSTILTQPTLVSPANNALNQPLTLTFLWQSVAGATGYHIQCGTDSNFVTTVIDQSGLTTEQYSVPPGTLLNNTLYFWRVRAYIAGCSSVYSTFRRFTTIVAAPPVPVPTLPANNAICETLTALLQWNAVSGATSYKLQLSTDSLFGTNIIDTTGLSGNQLTIQPARLQYFTRYFWRIAAVNIGGTSAWSTAWNFTTILEIPALLFPVNNAVNQSVMLTLNWLDVTGATSYSLQVSTDSLFTNNVINQSALDSSQYTVPGSVLLNNILYYWRVKANTTGCSGAYSSFWRFTTIVAPPPRPICISPPNNSVNQLLTPLLQWNASAGATSYNIQVATDSLFVNKVLDTTGITATQFSIPAGRLTFDTRYFWRVAGVNIGGMGQWSLIWNFRTVLPVIPFNITMIPGGFYNTGTSSLNMKDTIKAYLVDTAGGCHKVDSAMAIVDSISFIAQFVFPNASTGNYYVYIFHRNHLPVSTANMISFTRGVTSSYDLTNSATKAYGSNMIQVSSSPVRWGLIPGDANTDGFVDATDQAIWVAQNGLDGYLPGDFNGDMFVDATDQAIWVFQNGQSYYLPCELTFESVIEHTKKTKGIYNRTIESIIFQKQSKK